MATPIEEVRAAHSLIEAAGLPYPSQMLLTSFVNKARHPDVAARYVQRAIIAGGAESLVMDWTYIIESITREAKVPPTPDSEAQESIRKRDGNKCCITGKAGTFWDPLIVAPILPVPLGWKTDKPRIFDILGAFFDTEYRDWWLSYVEEHERTEPECSHWLVRMSAMRDFARGKASLERRRNSLIEFEIKHHVVVAEESIDVDGEYPLLGDHSRCGVRTVDPIFLSSHAKLARSIQWVEITRTVAQDSPRQSPSSSRTIQARHPTPHQRRGFSPSRLATSLFFTFWSIVPSRLRIAAYEFLIKAGKRLYRQPSAHGVFRLPFGLFLKRQFISACSRNEFSALQLVRRHTTIPVPRPLDLAIAHDPNADPRWPQCTGDGYVLTTRIPGIPLYHCQFVLSETDMAEISLQMTDYLMQLRTIPNTRNPAHPICNVLGEGLRDTRLRGGEEPQGPFADEAEFNTMFVRTGNDPARTGHKIVYTHADLNPRNILVEKVAREDGTQGWRVSGIVDWENSGFYPEYWEYTKSMFEGFRWIERYNEMAKGWWAFVGEGGYEKELEVERESWLAREAV